MTNDIKSATPELLLYHGYQYLKQIGEGANGKTYQAQSLKTGEIVAIKAIKLSDNLKNYELFEREAQTLKSLHTPGTPLFYEYITTGKEFTECWLVQEYIQGESLFDKLENCEIFDEAQTLEILLETAQIVRTLQTTYTPPIIHRDIKPSNILVRRTPKDGMKLCLIDFGAVANPQRRGVNSTVAGTVGYMAPEQLIGDCTIQSDYYALGATALHILTGLNPANFPSDGFTLQFEETLKQKIPYIHKETIELLHKLLAINPSDRPKDANDLVQQIVKSQNCLAQKLIKYETLNKITHSKLYSVFTFCLVLAIVFTILLVYSNILYKNQILTTDPFLFISLVLILLFSIIMSIPCTLYIMNLFTNTIRKNLVQSTPTILQFSNFDITDKPEGHKTIGIVRAVFDDYIEYTAKNDKRYYAAFMKVSDPSSYKIGDKITIDCGHSKGRSD